MLASIFNRLQHEVPKELGAPIIIARIIDSTTNIMSAIIFRKILLDNGIEKIIRRAKESHENCKAAATDALRDLGLENYNL